MKAVVADDDSSMRALLKHKTNNHKGRLPQEMSQPEWLADPSHRAKVVAKPIFLLSTMPMSSSTCTKVDTIRFEKYFGYFCCFITVKFPIIMILSLYNQYIVYVAIHLLFFPMIVMYVHLLIPKVSCPFWSTVEDILFSMNIVVLPCL